MFLWLSQRPFFHKSNGWISTAEFKIVFSGEAPGQIACFPKTTHNPCSGKGLENRVPETSRSTNILLFY